jgi:hypothetical protein
MAKIKINLTEDHIKLIKEFRIENIDDYHVGFDSVNPYGGTYLMQDLAMILGYFDKVVEGTEKDYDGPKYGIENETIMLGLHMYIMNHLDYILSIMVQFISIGVKPGLYTAIDYNLHWQYKG